MSDSAEGRATSWWDALRRRKVVQWGLLYVAGAWGFLQGLEYVGESFNWPQQVRQGALLALAVGLPIVIVLAWYHGDRGEQRFRGAEIAIIALLFVVGGGIFWRYERTSGVASTTASTPAVSNQPAAPDAAPRLRLAVLPLENLSPDPANAFFADGIHDEILSAMSATPDLQVVSRTTMRTYAGTTKTVKQIATELGASHLLEGAVRRAGDQVRLTLQLIDAGTDSNVWSQTFDRPLRDVLSLQFEVASDVATALNVRLLGSGDVAKKGSATGAVGTDPVAYDLYLKGKVQLDVRFSELQNTRDYDRLEALVARAIEIDPGFANAYAMRARVLLTRLWNLRDLSQEQWQTIGNDIDLARRLAGETAAVLAAQVALEYYGLMNYQLALQTTRAARAQFPNDLDLRQYEGLLLRRLGQWDESIAVFRELVNREGANPNYVVTLGESLLNTRQYREVVSTVHAFARRAAPDNEVAALGALASEAIERDPELIRLYVDTWRDRLDPGLSWGYEESYLRDAGRTEAVASHLIATKMDARASMGRFVDSGYLTPTAIMNGYGRMLRGAQTAPEQAREVLAAADRISWLPSREWNVALLEAQGALMSGDRKSAVAQAKRGLRMMTVERDAMLGPTTMVAAATVLAWAGEGTAAVPILRRAIEVPSAYVGWALVRDPLLAVPLAGNPAFEALKREVDPPN